MPGSQDTVIEFLNTPATYGPKCSEVRVVETHAALVFLTGRHAYKIKKAIRYPYLDFSTLEKRRRACERELEINQPHAPEIYLAVVPVCAMPDGSLRLGPGGTPLEWAVRMRQFPDEALLSHIADAGTIDGSMADRIAEVILRYHASAPVVDSADGFAVLSVTVDELGDAFSGSDEATGDGALEAFVRLVAPELAAVRHRLEQRGRRGFVRRCHGDLHTDNIVVIDGKPVLFDAIEFDEDIATIDVLYDLAFLVMDLTARQLLPQANRLLNHYLSAANGTAHIAGLQALPLFIACRAAIRAMVAMERQRQQRAGRGRMAARAEAARYSRLARSVLQRRTPVLTCIGGISGTGKTTIAREVAPRVGPPPGALHLRSDVERKHMFGVDELQHLRDEDYRPTVGHIVYHRLLRKAELALRAGCDVIVDAVFLDTREKRHAQRIARRADAGFNGIWLTADPETMTARIVQRRNDASDAGLEVMKSQLAMQSDLCDWVPVDANGTVGQVADAVRRKLSVAGG